MIVFGAAYLPAATPSRRRPDYSRESDLGALAGLFTGIENPALDVNCATALIRGSNILS